MGIDPFKRPAAGRGYRAGNAASFWTRVIMKLFECQHCGQMLYFENRSCLRCLHRLGYLPEQATLSALEPEGDAWDPLASPGRPVKFCSNAGMDLCNWMIPADSQET